MIFDTHTHIYEDQFANDYQDVIKRAVDNNVKLIMLPSDSISEAKKALDLVDNEISKTDKAAKILGISRATLYRKIKEYNL